MEFIGEEIETWWGFV